MEGRGRLHRREEQLEIQGCHAGRQRVEIVTLAQQTSGRAALRLQLAQGRYQRRQVGLEAAPLVVEIEAERRRFLAQPARAAGSTGAKPILGTPSRHLLLEAMRAVIGMRRRSIHKAPKLLIASNFETLPLLATITTVSASGLSSPVVVSQWTSGTWVMPRSASSVRSTTAGRPVDPPARTG
jgi:hypothetical protein